MGPHILQTLIMVSSHLIPGTITPPTGTHTTHTCPLRPLSTCIQRVCQKRNNMKPPSGPVWTTEVSLPARKLNGNKKRYVYRFACSVTQRGFVSERDIFAYIKCVTQHNLNSPPQLCMWCCCPLLTPWQNLCCWLWCFQQLQCAWYVCFTGRPMPTRSSHVYPIAEEVRWRRLQRFNS